MKTKQELLDLFNDPNRDWKNEDPVLECSFCKHLIEITDEDKFLCDTCEFGMEPTEFPSNFEQMEDR